MWFLYCCSYLVLYWFGRNFFYWPFATFFFFFFFFFFNLSFNNKLKEHIDSKIFWKHPKLRIGAHLVCTLNNSHGWAKVEDTFSFTTMRMISSCSPHSSKTSKLWHLYFFDKMVCVKPKIHRKLQHSHVIIIIKDHFTPSILSLRCGIVSIGKICRLFRHLYQNYHCHWSPLVAKWWKVTIPHRTLSCAFSRVFLNLCMFIHLVCLSIILLT